MSGKEVRLIDARKISNDIALYLAENSYLNSTALDALTMVFRWVREAPTIDPESLRPHGKWETDKEDVEWGNHLKKKYCTNCGKRPHYDKEKGVFILTAYCPNCGAKMEG